VKQIGVYRGYTIHANQDEPEMMWLNGPLASDLPFNVGDMPFLCFARGYIDMLINKGGPGGKWELKATISKGDVEELKSRWS